MPIEEKLTAAGCGKHTEVIEQMGLKFLYGSFFVGFASFILIGILGVFFNKTVAEKIVAMLGLILAAFGAYFCGLTYLALSRVA